MAYDQIRKFIAELELKPGQRWRGDCYVCDGTNTLSIRNDCGSIVYHCFRASCSLSGGFTTALSTQALETLFRCRATDETPKRFVIPDHFSSVDHRPECLNYLDRNNSLWAYKQGLADIRYDPQQNRVVFMCYQNGEIVGATGRALERSITPKWYIYGDGGCNFSLYVASKHAVLVEDCASCCSVGRVCDGIALLGTAMANINSRIFQNYDAIKIALDKDATNKAFQIQRELQFYVNEVDVVRLERDLKYCSIEEIERILSRGEKILNEA